MESRDWDSLPELHFFRMMSAETKESTVSIECLINRKALLHAGSVCSERRIIHRGRVLNCTLSMLRRILSLSAPHTQ